MSLLSIPVSMKSKTRRRKKVWKVENINNYSFSFNFVFQKTLSAFAFGENCSTCRWPHSTLKPLKISDCRECKCFNWKLPSDPPTYLPAWLLTFQREQLRAVEVQQSTQGRAVCAVLQQVVHRGDPGAWQGRGLLLPVPGLRNIKHQRYPAYIDIYITSTSTSTAVIGEGVVMCSVMVRPWLEL